MFNNLSHTITDKRHQSIGGGLINTYQDMWLEIIISNKAVEYNLRVG